MGANEIANRVEATAWIAAAGETDQDGIDASAVTPEDFFFRSISGFENRMEILSVSAGDDWALITTLTIALFLDRNYARKDTTFLLQPIESFRPDLDDPLIPLPLIYNGPLRVLPLSAVGFAAIKSGGAIPFVTPAALDPFSVLLIVVDLDEFQVVGRGLEFGIELVRMQNNDAPGTTAVTLAP